MKTRSGLLLQVLDEEAMEIAADYQRQIEQARRHAQERLALHRTKRRHLLALVGVAPGGLTFGPGKQEP
jgi:hypothetical protein